MESEAVMEGRSLRVPGRISKPRRGETWPGSQVRLQIAMEEADP